MMNLQGSTLKLTPDTTLAKLQEFALNAGTKRLYYSEAKGLYTRSLASVIKAKVTREDLKSKREAAVKEIQKRLTAEYSPLIAQRVFAEKMDHLTGFAVVSAIQDAPGELDTLVEERLGCSVIQALRDSATSH